MCLLLSWDMWKFTNDIGYSKVDGFMREDSDILNKVPHSLEIIKACKSM